MPKLTYRIIALHCHLSYLQASTVLEEKKINDETVKIAVWRRAKKGASLVQRRNCAWPASRRIWLRKIVIVCAGNSKRQQTNNIIKAGRVMQRAERESQFRLPASSAQRCKGVGLGRSHQCAQTVAHSYSTLKIQARLDAFILLHNFNATLP